MSAVRSAPARAAWFASWGGFAFWGGLACWVIAAWCWLRPERAVLDFMGWRQADTQTIALNLSTPGASLWFPQIRWGGDGPGYVETELQLYTALAAKLMRLGGPGEWAGQLVSLLAVAASAAILFWYHRREDGFWPAIGGTSAFLGARSVVQLATAIQPDGLSLCAYAGAWVACCRYAKSGKLVELGAFCALGAVAMLVKPTSAQLGISSFVLLLTVARERLKTPWPWLAWAAMLAALALFLAHARGLYTTYGNTFGILSGGDSKLPPLDRLFSPRAWFGAARNAVLWGYGGVGSVSCVALLALRRLRAEHWALLAGNLALTLLALRYTSQDAGVHYFAPCAVLGASATSALLAELLPQRRVRALGVALLVLGAGSAALVAHQRRSWGYADPTAWRIARTAEELEVLAGTNALVVVRSGEPRFDAAWKKPNNFEDPRVFYVAHARGWVLPADETSPRELVGYRARGARYFVDPLPRESPTALEHWLRENAELVLERTSAHGRIWKL